MRAFGGHFPEQAFRRGDDFPGRAAGEQVHTHVAHHGDPAGVSLKYLVEFHAGHVLQRAERVQARADKLVHDLADVAVGVFDATGADFLD